MEVLWCWRCRMEVPMLDEEEYAKAYELYGKIFRKTTGSIAERAQELVDYYKDITGFEEAHHNAIMHHRISQYGCPCEKCGKPYRTPLASFCAACGNKKRKMISVIDEGLWEVVVTSMYEVEFDWIGIDRIGQVGLFSSFNRGYIPAKVLSSYELYKQFMEVINTLPSNSKFSTVFDGPGAVDYWENITEMGIWTFDYQDAHRTEKLDQYDLIAKPTPAINISQIFPINDFKAMIPVFNLEFNGNITFEVLRQNEY